MFSRRDLSHIESVSKYITERLINEAWGPHRICLRKIDSSSDSDSKAMYNGETAKLPGDKDPFLVSHMPTHKLSNTLVGQPRTDGATANSGRQKDSSKLYKVEPVRKPFHLELSFYGDDFVDPFSFNGSGSAPLQYNRLLKPWVTWIWVNLVAAQSNFKTVVLIWRVRVRLCQGKEEQEEEAVNQTRVVRERRIYQVYIEKIIAGCLEASMQ